MLSLLLVFTHALQEPVQVVTEGIRVQQDASPNLSSIDYIAFDVPAGVARIEVEFQHSADNVVEIGIFDPRGHEKGGSGFRGWQGATTGSAAITGEPATTSSAYLAGPIQPGKWHIAQWYIKSTADGLKYKYTVKFTLGEPTTNRFPDVPRWPDSIPNTGSRWYAGNLHAHTIHSDGFQPLTDVATLHATAGLDFVAITDHNATRHHFELAQAARANPKLLIIAGNEFTSSAGHANILGAKPGHWYDFRIEPNTEDLKKTIKEVHKHGALFTINHPFAEGGTTTWRYPQEEWEEADGIEVWNGAWTHDDDQAFAFWQEKAVNSKRRYTILGGADYHQEGDPLTPVVWVNAPSLSKASILKAIREGKVVLTQTAKMVPPELTVGGYGPGQTVKATIMRDPNLPKGITMYAPMELAVRVKGYKGHALHVRSTWGEVGFKEGTLITSDDFVYKQYVRPGGDGFYRAEIRSGDQANWGAILALTNPVYSRK